MPICISSIVAFIHFHWFPSTVGRAFGASSKQVFFFFFYPLPWDEILGRVNHFEEITRVISCNLLKSYLNGHYARILILWLIKLKLLFPTPWTVAYQAPPSMGFSRQEYWSGLPSPSPGDHPDPGIEPWSPTPQADTLAKPLHSF